MHPHVEKKHNYVIRRLLERSTIAAIFSLRCYNCTMLHACKHYIHTFAMIPGLVVYDMPMYTISLYNFHTTFFISASFKIYTGIHGRMNEWPIKLHMVR